MSERALDALTDKVLAHRPTSHPLKVIAGTPDTPLIIGDVEIPCYVLEDETRVLSQRGFLAGIGRSEQVRGRPQSGGDKLPGFLSANNLKPFIDNELSAATTAILFQLPQGGPPAYGYQATLLPQVCEVYLRARAAGALRANQRHIADRAEILIRGLAVVGIIALVDEATGYQRIREERTLAAILERYLADDLHPWTRTFPFSFYEQIFRLNDWGSAGGVKRPSVIGHYTNDIVYDRVAPGVLDELRQRNPVLPRGWRRHRHHQWFTDEFGHPALKEHIAAVIALMRAAPSWASFKRSLDRALPKVGTTIGMPLEDEDL